MTNPITIIKNDHKEVDALFNKYKALGDQAFKTKLDTANEMIEMLTMHAEMEEKLFYPKIQKKFNKEEDKMVEEAYTEHGVAKKLMAEIKSADVEDPQFDARVKVLTEMVTHHVKEEEDELLPQAEKELSEDELDAIGKEMEIFRAEYGTIQGRLKNLI